MKYLPVEGSHPKCYAVGVKKKDRIACQEGDALCCSVDEINEIARTLNPKHLEQIILAIQFLAVSSGEQEKEQFLDQLLKEIPEA